MRKVFDLRPAAIIDELDLKRPIYSKTAAYGHFGREDADFTWEATNMVDELKEPSRLETRPTSYDETGVGACVTLAL